MGVITSGLGSSGLEVVEAARIGLSRLGFTCELSSGLECAGKCLGEMQW